MITEKTLCEIADFLPEWGSTGTYSPGVKAVCVAGGGESLPNPATPVFIDRLAHNGIEIGVVTNGTRINTCIDALSQCTWVGVSVDAGSAKTFNKLKGLPENSQTFTKIIDNMATLADYSRCYDTRLGASHPSYGVSYKYLLYKENIGEIYEAAKTAKAIGCKSIHFRPAGTTWNNVGTSNEITFTEDDIALWGSEKHWQIHSSLDIHTCPRCTYQPHNQIYEEVILNDSMTYKFI